MVFIRTILNLPFRNWVALERVRLILAYDV